MTIIDLNYDSSDDDYSIVFSILGVVVARIDKNCHTPIKFVTSIVLKKELVTSGSL